MSTATLPALYRHSKRHQWGLGVMLLKLTDRAYMQFQDGQTRTMHLDYDHLLEPVDRPYDVARGLVEALEDMAPDELRPGKKAVRRVVPITLAEQMSYFRELYAGGFGDAAYAEHHRGDGRKRPLKRHRDGVVAQASAAMSKEAFEQLRVAGGPAAVFAAATKLVKQSDLVPPAGRRAFAAIDANHHEAITDALYALLHGRAQLTRRFDDWVRALEVAMGQTPGWPLATLFLGVVEPKSHLVVKPGAVKLQAQFMAPGIRVGARPMGLLYERLLAMAVEVRDRMQGAELEPRDLLDVYDFMWLTLKPAARKRIEDIRFDAALNDIRAAASEEAA